MVFNFEKMFTFELADLSKFLENFIINCSDYQKFYTKITEG